MSESEYRRVVAAIASFIESRKLNPSDVVLVPDALGGFNLACDFLAHELRALLAMDNLKLAAHVQKESK